MLPLSLLGGSALGGSHRLQLNGRPLDALQTMPTTDYRDSQWDDDWDYPLSLWVDTNKTQGEFVASLSRVVYPIPIAKDRFTVGAIECEIVTPKESAPRFDGVPSHDYRHAVIIGTTTAMIWGFFDKQFALALAFGVQQRLTCRWLLEAENEMFVAYCGTNLPLHFNSLYPAWSSGAYAGFKATRETIAYELPPLPR